MKESKDLLSSALKTTQMGQVGIRCVMKLPLNSNLKSALHSQLREYDTIEREVQSIASARGWELEDLAPVAKTMSKMVTRMQLSYGDRNSKVAAMMVQGNTRGMIKGLKNMHHYKREDNRVTQICQKLLDREEENIKQMQGFI